MTTDAADTSLDENDVLNEFDSFVKEEILMERTLTMVSDLTVNDEKAEKEELPKEKQTTEDTS